MNLRITSNLKSYLSVLFAVLMFFFISAAFASPTSPKTTIQNVLDQLVNTVERYPSDQDTSLRRKELRGIISPHFDFREMAKRSLGVHWSKISEGEQTEFADVFTELLADTYIKRIEKIQPGQVSVDGQKVRGTKALVNTLVEDKGDKFPINYKFLNRSGHWKVYDVIIENIGLVANYRTEFAGIIRKEKFAGLLQRLKDKQAGS